MAVLKVNCFDKFDVELLRFGELVFIGCIKVNSCSKTTVEVADSVRDAGVWMKEMRGKFEEEVLS